MKRPSPNTILLSLALFFSTAACLLAAETLPAAGSKPAAFLQTHLAKLWIPILVPSLLAAFKAIWPTIPRVALPYLCPVLGAGLSFLGPLINQDIDPGLAGALGAIGNWLRELFDQTKKEIAKSSGMFALGFAALVCVSPAVAAPPAPAPTPPPAPAAPSSAFERAVARISVSPFATYRVHEFGARNGKLGGGLAAGFALTKHVTLEAEVIAERFDDSHWFESLTEAGANFRLSARPGALLNPYGLLGYTANLDESEHRMNAGAGLEVNFSDHVGVFLDGRWTHNFTDVGHALFRLGATLRF